MYNNRLNTNDIDTLYRDKNNKNCVRTKTNKELRTNSYNDCERVNNYEQNSVSLKKKNIQSLRYRIRTLNKLSIRYLIMRQPTSLKTF